MPPAVAEGFALTGRVVCVRCEVGNGMHDGRPRPHGRFRDMEDPWRAPRKPSIENRREESRAVAEAATC